ncbi:hypothetical protein EX30DRAFT_264362 [Ascodesmis nigricans]|uniref:Uncharacterized protein n=1 Tax=Ascodesmis nigricans TaxID=341454 RepID=A0A4S2MXP6_9PEZI|nr:hypothetical protein EX30DRAFT_264362 [Ascodesmis nigricans]
MCRRYWIKFTCGCAPTPYISRCVSGCCELLCPAEQRNLHECSNCAAQRTPEIKIEPGWDLDAEGIIEERERKKYWCKTRMGESERGRIWKTRNGGEEPPGESIARVDQFSVGIGLSVGIGIMAFFLKLAGQL